jgi:hypothetical protein
VQEDATLNPNLQENSVAILLVLAQKYVDIMGIESQK